jgi:mRNA-degrading endonuclease RelE of RelBE toxin-antitoxin system
MFEITFTESALEDLEFHRKFDQALVFDAVAEQLAHEPETETHNRKRLRETGVAQWELRAGLFRVFYNVAREERRVDVVAVAKKEHNKLYIRGEEAQL